MTPALARRRALLTAALGFALLDTRGNPTPPAVETVRKWLDNWKGSGTSSPGCSGRATG
jgi:hypothetical protein